MTAARGARRGRSASRALGLAAALAALAACSLPPPDGLEADLIAQAAALSPLRAAEGNGPGAVARAGLLLDPEVRRRAAEADAAADAIRVARAARFPSLGLSLGGGVGTTGPGAAGAELRARQTVTDFGRTDRAVAAADVEMRIAYVAFGQAVDEALVETLSAYDAVVRAIRLVEVREAQVAALEALQDRVAERVEIGAAPRSDLLETRIGVRAARFELDDARLAEAEARDRLAELTGRTRGGEAPAPPVGDCAAPEADDAVRLARLALAGAELALADARTARRPGVFVEPVLRRREGDGGVRAGLDVAVNSDLIQGGRLSAAVDAAEDERAAAAAAVEAARRETVLEGRRRLRDIAAAERRIALLQDQIALLTEARALYRMQYLELGTRRIAELLDNEEEFHARQAELIALRGDLAVDRIDCAAREDRLRGALGLADATLYGLPLTTGPS